MPAAAVPIESCPDEFYHAEDLLATRRMRPWKPILVNCGGVTGDQPVRRSPHFPSCGIDSVKERHSN